MNVTIIKIHDKKQTFCFLKGDYGKIKSYIQMILKLVKSQLWKFEEDCLKNVGEDIF